MPNRPVQVLLTLLTGVLLSVGACSSSSTEPSPDCVGDKCDDPGQSADRECAAQCGSDAECVETCRREAALQHCEARKADAIDAAQKAFTRDNIRWACSDVEGVDTNLQDNRGQEYCEYYAAIQLPPEEPGGELPALVTTGRAQANQDLTPLSVTLNQEQIFALEDEPDAVVGQCIFTSWHSDVGDTLPVCGGSEATCPRLAMSNAAQSPSWITSGEYDLPITRELMKMKHFLNSNGAASDLFNQCLVSPLVGDESKTSDPLHDDFTRGCMHAFELFQTDWRRSDPSICAAGGRLTECGCGVDTDGDGVANITDPQAFAAAVLPRQPEADGTVRLRGFHLGTWSDANALPAGCHYVDTGDAGSTRTLVACDLTATDLLASATDPKQRCRDKFGDNVVVHVALPADAIVCSPPADGPYTDTCGAQPWVVGNENF